MCAPHLLEKPNEQLLKSCYVPRTVYRLQICTWSRYLTPINIFKYISHIERNSETPQTENGLYNGKCTLNHNIIVTASLDIENKSHNNH